MHLPRTAAFYLQASIVLFFLAGSSAPTPLYAVYQAQWGFSPIVITLIFGIYALSVLAALLVVGSLSDYIGRRPVLLSAVLAQAFTMVLFARADGVTDLLVARVLQGLAAGAAAGAVGAGMLDIDRTKGTVANAVAPMLGTATGGVLSGFLVQYLPAPTQLVYWVLGGVFVMQAVGVLYMRETATPRAGVLAALRPRLAVPPRVRKPLLLGAPALIAAWALAGFYGSLGPSVVRTLAGTQSFLLGGLAVFVLASAGALGVLLTRSQPAREQLRVGTAALASGVAISLLAIDHRSLALFFFGTAVAGGGFGLSFQSVIRSVVPLAQEHERAGVLSTLYVLSYLAMGLPAVLAGVRVVYGGGVLLTAQEYGVVVMVLAALAWIGTQLEQPLAAAADSATAVVSSRR